MTTPLAEVIALLPCPWCGQEMGPPTVSEGSTFRWRKVDGCCADGPEVRHNTMADDQAAAEIESTAKAIAAWNTRPALRDEGRDWLPIESAPKDGARILVCGGTWAADGYDESPFSAVSIAFWDRDHWRGDDLQSHDSWIHHKPTHWQPLPTALPLPSPGEGGEA